MGTEIEAGPTGAKLLPLTVASPGAAGPAGPGLVSVPAAATTAGGHDDRPGGVNVKDESTGSGA
jgi:hypothetical protein